MPELPVIVIYIEVLESRVGGQPFETARIVSPCSRGQLRPPLEAWPGKRVLGFRQLGKLIAMGLEDDSRLVLHLTIAGRLHWRLPRARVPGKRGLATFEFPTGAVLLTEAGSEKRASPHVVRDEEALGELHRGARKHCKPRSPNAGRQPTAGTAP